MHVTLRAASALLLLAGTAAVGAPTLPFCERMAADTGMKPDKNAPGIAWQVNKLGGVGTMLFGGSVSFMLSVKPNPGASGAAIAATDCKSDGKDIACTIQGPATLVLTVNGNNFTYAAEAGEAAKVSILRSKVLRCEALPQMA